MFEIKEAQRQGTPALIGIWGPSGCGKTYTALLVARGLVGPKGKIVLIDTENHRASIYAELEGVKPWYHMDLQPPFTPQRYTEAMKAAEAGGADVIIIDSASHVWEGEGGVLDMAESSGSKGILKWQAPKMAYKRMLNALLRSRVNVIFCLRAKDKNVQRPNAQGKTEIINLGLFPICEKGFIYEMTVATRLDQEHLPHEIKAPEDLADAVPAGRVLTANTGQLITQWIEGGAPVNHELEALKRTGREIATFGTAKLRGWWEKQVPAADKAMLEPYKDEFKHLAAQADQEAAGEAGPAEDHPPATAPAYDPLADEFTGTDESEVAAAEPEPDTPSEGSPEPGPVDTGPAPDTQTTAPVFIINRVHGVAAQHDTIEKWAKAMITRIEGTHIPDGLHAFWQLNYENIQAYQQASKVNADAIGPVTMAYGAQSAKLAAPPATNGKLV